MFKINFLITIRNFARNKAYSFINILGLSIGMACVLLILSWVRFELSFDRYHHYSDRIYRVERPPFSTLAPSFVPLLKQDFPEIEEIARIMEADGQVLKYQDRSFVEKKALFAEEGIFNIFSINFISGDRRTALSQPNTMVLSESMAKKYFGNDDPLGKTLVLFDTIPLTVTGIIGDIPANTHIHFDFLISYLTLKIFDYEYFFGGNNFSDNICMTYLRIANGTNPDALEAKFPKFIDRYLDPYKDESGKFHLASESMGFKLVKVTDIHLYSHTNNEAEANGDVKYVKIFSLIALFILLIACINFINLSIARGLQRIREVAVKKTFGSGRGNIILEMITGTFLYSAIALFLAVVIYETAIPFFRGFWTGWTGKNFFSDPENLMIMVGILIITNLLAGLYPALYLSRYQPVQMLKNSLSLSSGQASKTERGLLRKSLVIIQFSISIAVMVGIGVINKQMRFLQSTDLGYDRENILLFPADNVLLSKWESYRQKMLSGKGIEQVTMSKRAPTGRLLDAPGFEIEVKGELIKNTFFMPHNRIEHDFFKTYGIKIIAGRDFDRAIQTDATEAAILNETAVRLLGFDSPELAVGARIKPEGSEYMTIIGVCRDFHYESLHHKITAMISYIATDQANTVAVRLTPGNITERISAVREVWNEFHQDTPFEYSFLDERINDQYKNEQRMLGLFNWFGVLAVIIACLGLYGLTAYSTARRTKEIGIRRVNGASTREIMFMFSVDFTKLIAVAFIIICPVSYYLMHRWLQNFMYKTTLSWWVFLLAGLTAFIIALLTISWQTWRAATRDPLESLRYE